MLWWLALVALAALGAAILFRRNWVAPWKTLEQLVGQVARGEQPKTFLIDGNRYVWRIGIALENLLARQQHLDQQLSQDSAEIRTVFAALTDAVVVLDQTQRIRFCNPAFENFFARAPVDPGTALPEILRHVEISQGIDFALREREAQMAEVRFSEKDFQFVAVPVVRDSGDLAGVVAIFHDISRLKETDKIRRDLVANVSHELRTPLSIFRGNLETLLEDENLGREEAGQIYAAMKRHSDRLNRLVEDLLTLARLEAREMKLQLSPIDTHAFLKRIGEDWQKRAAQKHLKLELSAASDLPTINADEFRLEQVLYNLLDNAVNYSPEGGRIRISAVARDNRMVLSVSDEGPGIPAADLPRIFERFYRADKARSRVLGSTGLGLSIVKHIAQMHGGDVCAESELGKGTSIQVLLPL